MVNAQHAEYSLNLPKWKRIRDALSGEDAIKAGGESYVPRLDSQSDEEYEAYVARSYFYNCTSRTLAGYLGLIFTKDPVLKKPVNTPLLAVFEAFEDDVDLKGTTLNTYARHIANDVLAVGRCGTLVDWSEPPEARAYFSFYAAETIINWRVQRIGSHQELVLVTLAETLSIPDPDGYGDSPVEQLRVLRLMPSGSDYQYVVELWQQTTDEATKKTEWKLLETKMPLRNGKPLNRIPFVFHGPSDNTATPEHPPMDDLISTNLAHYRLTTDFFHGMHYTALPTAWVSGFDKNTVLKVGATAAWVTEQLGATAGYLEFQGQGLQTFERTLDRIERLVSVLGSRLLESQKRVSESAEALAIRQAGETCILANISKSCSDALTDALRWLYWWHSTEASYAHISTDLVSIVLNTDFITATLSADEIASLVSAWQAGALSRDSLHYQFQRGEILPSSRTLDEELAMIKAHPAPVPLLPQPNPTPGHGQPPPNTSGN